MITLESWWLVGKAVEAKAGQDDGKADDVEDVTGLRPAEAWLQCREVQTILTILTLRYAL